MDAQLHDFLLRERKQQVDYIVRHAHRYKACDQCRALVPKTYPHCHACSAYRFNEDAAYVKTTAKQAGARALPLDAAFVPRVKKDNWRNTFKSLIPDSRWTPA